MLKTDLVLSGVFLFLHFGQSELKIINVLLQLRTFILKLSFLGSQLSIHFFFILQSLSQLFGFSLKLDLAFDQTLTSLLSIYKIVLLLLERKNKYICICKYICCQSIKKMNRINHCQGLLGYAKAGYLLISSMKISIQLE